MNKLTRTQTRLALAGAGILSLGAMVASASTMGGVTASRLGADTSVIASCDTDGVALDYTESYDATSGKYRVSGVTVSGINAACNGETLAVTLANGANTALSSGTATVAGTSQAVVVAPADADAIAKTAVVIR